MIDRTELRRAYRPDENALALQRLSEATLDEAQAADAAAVARSLSKAVRGHKPAGIDAFMAAYDLGSDEGIALMCLAEALLRIPDSETADDLIADKLSGPDWAEKIGDSRSTFVNAATFSLLLTGKVLDEANDRSDGWRAALGRAVGRLGEPVIRTAVSHGMKILGKQFVFGRTIAEALGRAGPERSRGLNHSFDMLGEAARTHEDAARYAQSYSDALDAIAAEAQGGFRASPGISVKLSALHPRYEWNHADEVKAAIIPVLRELAMKASAVDVHFTIDAEEADRLELSLDIIEALVADDALFANDWGGFGLRPGLRSAPLVWTGPPRSPQVSGKLMVGWQGRLWTPRSSGAGRGGDATGVDAKVATTCPISPAPGGCSTPALHLPLRDQ